MKLRDAFIAAIVLFAGIRGVAQTGRQGCTSPSHYKVVPLPFHPAHINNSGAVVGTTEDRQPVVWTQKDGPGEIALPAGFSATAAPAINRAGDVVGTLTQEGSPRPYAFRYSGGKLTLLSDDPSKAAAIADTGDIAGENANLLVLWRQGRLVPLGGCCGGAVRGINRQGHVVGQLNDRSGRYSAFLSEGHKVRSIAPAEGTMSSAVAINDAGYVLVQSFVPDAVFLWRGGKFTGVKLAADVANQPQALNNCNVIVGEFGAASDFYHAFVWAAKTGLRDLNSLIDDKTGWILESAVDINDRGRIVGVGDHGREKDAGFLLVPEQPIMKHESARR